MKHYLFILFLFMLFTAVACNKEKLETSFEEVAKVNPHLIPKEKALASLHSFLASQNVGVTKAIFPR